MSKSFNVITFEIKTMVCIFKIYFAENTFASARTNPQEMDVPQHWEDHEETAAPGKWTQGTFTVAFFQIWQKNEILKNLRNGEKNDRRHYAFYWIWQ